MPQMARDPFSSLSSSLSLTVAAAAFIASSDTNVSFDSCAQILKEV